MKYSHEKSLATFFWDQQNIGIFLTFIFVYILNLYLPLGGGIWFILFN